jgi:hypothetical protein
LRVVVFLAVVALGAAFAVRLVAGLAAPPSSAFGAAGSCFARVCAVFFGWALMSLSSAAVRVLMSSSVLGLSARKSEQLHAAASCARVIPAS